MKILVVSQRYGADAGDAARHARALAVRLSASHEVEIATIARERASAPDTADDGTVDGLRVRRFAPSLPRRDGAKTTDELLSGAHTLADEWRWHDAQTPHSAELLEFLHRGGRSYDVVVFHEFRSRPTSGGLPIVPERSVLIPFVQADDALLDLAPYRALFQMPRAFGFLSREERDLVHARCRNAHIAHEIVGGATEGAPDDLPRLDALVELAVP